MKRFLIRRPPQPSRLPWKAARGEEWQPSGEFINAADPFHAMRICVERGRGEVVVGVLIAIAPDDPKADEILAQANAEGAVGWEDAPESEVFDGFGEKGRTKGVGVVRFLNLNHGDAGENLDDPESGEEWKRGGKNTD